MPSEVSSVQDKAVRLFTYLRDFAQLRTQVTRDWSNYESILWFHEVPHEPACFTVAWGAEREDGVWLEVKRRKEPPCPPIPKICEDWVDPTTVYSSDSEPQLRERILDPRTGEDAPPAFLELKNHTEVQEQWLEYLIQRWTPWAEEHRHWRSVQAIYGKLFTIYQDQKRLGEEFELILGLGLLTWITPSGQRVRRHILAGQANISFDANRGILFIQSGSDGVKLALETDMLEPTERPPVEQQLVLEQVVSEASESPWDRGLIEPILRRWVHSIDPQGDFSETLEPATQVTTRAELTFAPALILRKRTTRSLVHCLSTIADKIKGGGEIPFGVRRLCEIVEDRGGADGGNASRELEKGGHSDTEVYFPLAANDEQLRIIERFGSRQGVLVQGPPGTGKSHTIANLICHLLATGKRVLVTSQTPRALKVLKGMIPEQMAALCVSVLGNDVDSMRNLEESVSGITDQYHNWDPTANERKVSDWQKKIYALRRRLAEIDRRFRELREKETYQHHVAGGAYRGTAQSIAERLAAEEPVHGWFPGEIGEQTELPFEHGHFEKLLMAYRHLTRERCEALSKKVIPRSELPDVTEFLTLVEKERRASEKRQQYKSRWSQLTFQILLRANGGARQELLDALRGLQTTVANVRRRPESWVSRAIDEILTAHDLPWKNLHESSGKLLRGLREKAQAADARNVSIPQGLDRDKLRADAETLLSHLNAGGSLGWWIFRKSVVKESLYLTKDVRVNGRNSDNPQTLTELIRQLDVESNINRLWATWKGIAAKVDGPLPRQVALLEEHQEALDLVLGLEQPLTVAKAKIAKIQGLAEPAWQREESVNELLAELEAVEAEEAYAGAKTCFDQLLSALKATAAEPSAHEINRSAIQAVEDREYTTWAAVVQEIEALEEDRRLLKERDQLSEKLGAVAPKLLAVIAENPNHPAWDERLGKIEETWAWARANGWMRAFLSQNTAAELEEELGEIQKSLRERMADLAAARAWGFCFERMLEEQRQNLIAWAHEVRLIGRGTGRYAERHRRAAQRHMDKCREAIPAWIMPFYRVAETVLPEPTSYDVVIVDEASQSGPEALMLQYLGKQIIIVGDDQQISPDFVGVDQEAVQLLIEHRLSDFDHSNTFGVGFSLFAHAEIRYEGRIVLREHFRCMPEIIRFSNDLCYRDTPLRPLRQYPPQRLEPIVVHHIRDGFREGGSSSASNRPEAEAIVEAVCKCLGDPAYENKTMGVISLQGEYQARLIQKVLSDRLQVEGRDKDIELRRIVCGDAYSFQGDERDIVFLSMVAAVTDQNGGHVQIGALTQERDKRRFNVAASRARDQVWLFHTATLNDLNREDMRAKLLSYYLNPQRSILAEPDWSRCESDFERKVGPRIYARGYRVWVQYEPFGPGGKRIDLVVEGLKSRLAVECDGDYWHGPEQFDEDMRRQRQLERCGLVFWRVRGSAFYRNPEKALEPLWKRLEDMGIYPAGGEPVTDVPPTPEVPAPTVPLPALPVSVEAEFEAEVDSGLPSAAAGGRDIADFHQNEVRAALWECIPLEGQIDRESLLQRASRRLGFSRLGQRIRTRLNRAVGAEIRAGRLGSNGEKVRRINPPNLFA